MRLVFDRWGLTGGGCLCGVLRKSQTLGHAKSVRFENVDEIVCYERVAGSALGVVVPAVASGFRTGDGLRRWGLLRHSSRAFRILRVVFISVRCRAR
jgi:hypothetical protein